jgi:hypothetical protein
MLPLSGLLYLFEKIMMGFQKLANWQKISQSGHPVLMVFNLQLSFNFTHTFNLTVRLRTF